MIDTPSFHRLKRYQSGYQSRIGLFSYEQYSIGSSGKEPICTPYSLEQREDLLDGPFKAARASAVFAHVFIGSAMIGLLVLSCAYLDIVIVKIFGWLLIVGSICEVLTFLLFASDIAGSPFNGSIWWGSILVVVASLTALVAGILTLRLPVSENQPSAEEEPATKVSPPKRQNKERKMPPGTETTTSTIMPDGRTKYTTTKWNKDGTKTVTETIE